jgi:putative thioredoxin
MSVPVVVDLWSPRSVQCKQLSPILERLAGEFAGRFILAKVDVDSEPAIAQMFQVQSVPSVVAIIAGNPAPLFQSLVTETAAREVFTQLLDAAAKMGISGQAEMPAPPSDPRFEAAEAALDAGDWNAAIAAYETILASSPADPIAKIGLLNVALLARTDGKDLGEELALVGDDVETQLRIADAQFLSGLYGECFDRLIPHAREKQVRDRLLEYFDIVGPSEPDVVAARRKLASALF